MSMNRFMHPRNIYRVPPDFTQLALDFEEFRNAGSLNINGKFSVDFQNVSAVRSLTKCLLKRDFGLDVNLPANKLVPTLPLRLNYVLWLEDIVKGIVGNKEEKVVGVDIGCGASCVYPFLAVRNNEDWSMIGLESNPDSVRYARQNVAQNGLDHRITIVEQESDTESSKIFATLLQTHPSTSFAFCMCNPPFFGSMDDLQPPINLLGKRNRSGKRPAAKCPQTGSTDELFVSGGEIGFVGRIIEESFELQKCIRVFTTMLGHKASVAKVLQSLRDRSVANICTAEFCQGHTTRWGVAWSFDDAISLKNTPQFGPSSVKTVCESKSYSFTMQNDLLKTLNDIKNNLDDILKSIGISIIDSNDVSNTQWTGKVVTYKNAWSNQRRKRRQIQRNIATTDNNDLETNIISNTASIEPLLMAKLTAICKPKPEPNIGSIIIIDVEYIGGTGKKDAANQLMHFIQNQWK